MAKVNDTTARPHFQFTATIVSQFTTTDPVNIRAHEGKGYKEKHDLVVVHRSDEAHNGDEQQEDAHSDDPSDDVDARHQAEPLPPCCYSD